MNYLVCYGISIGYVMGFVLTCSVLWCVISGLMLVCRLLDVSYGGGNSVWMCGDSGSIGGSLVDMLCVSRYLLCFGGIAMVSVVQWCHGLGVHVLWMGLMLHIARSTLLLSWFGRLTSALLGLGTGVVFIVVSVLGYIMAWGTLSYWGAVVIGSLLGCGGRLLFHGGVSLGWEVMGRCLMLHYLGGIVGLVVAGCHMYSLHMIGVSGSDNGNVGDGSVFVTWGFLVLCLDGMVGWCFIGLVTLVVVCLGVNLGDAVGVEMLEWLDGVSVGNTPTLIVPEWYFVWMFGVLRTCDSTIGGLLVVCVVMCSATVWMLVCVCVLSVVGLCGASSIVIGMGSSVMVCGMLLM